MTSIQIHNYLYLVIIAVNTFILYYSKLLNTRSLYIPYSVICAIGLLGIYFKFIHSAGASEMVMLSSILLGGIYSLHIMTHLKQPLISHIECLFGVITPVAAMFTSFRWPYYTCLIEASGALLLIIIIMRIYTTINKQKAS